jgi:Cu/Ag efflux pump CusA
MARGRKPRPETILERRIRGLYASVLERTARRAAPVFVVVAVVAVLLLASVGAAAAPQLGATLMPAFKQRDVLIAWQGAPGASYGEMNRIASEVSQQLGAVEGVRDVGAHIGRAITSDQIVGIDAGEVWVSIDRAADHDATLAAIQGIIDGRADLEGAVLTYPAQRIESILGAATADVTVRVYGHDQDTIQAQAESIRQALEGVDGLAGLTLEQPVMEESVEIAVDPSKAEPYGLAPGDVRRAAATLISGLEVGNLFEEQKVFEVVVRGVPEIRDSIDDIAALSIDTPTGETVRLGDVATVSTVSKPSAVSRESVFRRADVTASVEGREIGAVLADVNAAIATVDMPLEYHATVFSAAAERQSAVIGMAGIVLAIVIAIYLILQAAFGSWRLSLGVLLAIPAAASGGALGLLATGGQISIGLLAGFFVIIAIAVRQMMSLVDRYRHLERAQAQASGLGLILQGAQERVGPILTTALATAAAMLPILVLGSAPGLEVLWPMAAVIVGGLLTSTLMTLVVVPVVYLNSGPSAEPQTIGEMLHEEPGMSPA